MVRRASAIKSNVHNSNTSTCAVGGYSGQVFEGAGSTSTTQPAARRAAAGVPSLTKMSVGGTPSTSVSKPPSTAAMCAALWPRSSSSSVA